MFTAESDSEVISKIGEHLPKLWAIKYRVVFLNETWCIQEVTKTWGTLGPRSLGGGVTWIRIHVHILDLDFHRIFDLIWCKKNYQNWLARLPAGMPQYINVKHSVASVIMQYNLVPVKAVGKHADWACVQDETQAEPLPLALRMDG